MPTDPPAHLITIRPSRFSDLPLSLHLSNQADFSKMSTKEKQKILKFLENL